ncbi:MAG: hypothetical protein VZR95_05240 [Alphaproteobacteria bacterium]
MNKIFSLLLMAGIVAGIYYLITPQPFPSSVFQNTDKSDRHYNLLNSKQNAVIWSSANTEMAQDRNAEISDLMRYNHYDRSYLYIADIGGEEPRCRNGSKKCIAFWIQKNCETKYCIYIAETKKVIKVNYKDKNKLLKVLEKHQKK